MSHLLLYILSGSCHESDLTSRSTLGTKQVVRSPLCERPLVHRMASRLPRQDARGTEVSESLRQKANLAIQIYPVNRQHMGGLLCMEIATPPRAFYGFNRPGVPDDISADLGDERHSPLGRVRGTHDVLSLYLVVVL